MKKSILAAVAACSLVGIRAAVEHADGVQKVLAVRGARIVTAAGPSIESGTIVIRDGLIEAVGAGVVPPVEAEVIEGRGLTVYPGLIDLGNTHAADRPIPQTPTVRTTAELERWKRDQILKPQARAADDLKPDDPDLAKMASAGVTTVLATPSGDVISGQSALIEVVAPPDEPQIGSLAAARHDLAIIKAPVALHVSFPNRPRAGGSAYPESLMGVIAFVRQAFLDAQHYDLARAHIGRLSGTEPATSDPALDAMLPFVERKLPVAFEANQSREILRALAMARELKLDPIITGARDASPVAADLKSAGARVIFSLNYPERPRALPPDADEPIRVLRERAEAPGTPAALAKEGIPFAFESAGLSDPKDFVRNAAKAVRAGLSLEAAVRALTSGAATIAGVADRLGTLEKGKIANLVVTDGDLFEEKTRVLRVFVGGRAVDLEAPNRALTDARAAASSF
jgi:imidazolonepropionase-like amidohydrolase